MKLVSTLVLVSSFLGCAGEEPGSPVAGDAPPATVDASEAALKIEQAERLLERGGDAGKALDLLRAALGEADITPDERSTAILAQSRAYEALGDREHAIGVVEAEMAAHGADRSWQDRPFTKRLRKLLGAEGDGTGNGSDEPVAAFAGALVPYFPPNAAGTVVAQMFFMGGNAALSERLGTFNISGAIREKQEKDCPLCEHEVDVNAQTSSSDWTLVPRREKEFAQALVVFWFDLGKNRVPARYEELLPMKVAEIERQLEAGKAFAVAKEREGAPPVILLAAPRTQLLADVEQRIVGMDELPLEPVYVEVKLNLRPEEIQSVMRGKWFSDVRGCYEELQKTAPRAEGKFEAVFQIGETGTVVEHAIETKSAALEDAAFQECLTKSLARVTFPATGNPTTVRYPVVVSPE
jgi:hypothetical protein